MENFYFEMLQRLALGTGQGVGQELVKYVTKRDESSSYKNSNSSSTKRTNENSIDDLIKQIDNTLNHSRIAVDNKVFVKNKVIYFSDGNQAKKIFKYQTKINTLLDNVITITIFFWVLTMYFIKNFFLVDDLFLVFLFSTGAALGFFLFFYDDKESPYKGKHEFNISINLVSGEIIDKYNNKYSLKNLIEVTRKYNTDAVLILSTNKGREDSLFLAEYKNVFEFVTLNFLIALIQSNIQHKFIPN